VELTQGSISGGGTGIGVEIACSFAVAGAPTIAISGRTEKTLLAAKTVIEASFPPTKVLTFVADSTDENAVNAAFQAVGHVDILVNNAGFMAELVPVSASEPANWWKAFEVNVLGAYLVTRAFLKVAAPKDAVLINLISAAAQLSPYPDYSSYQASKLAGTKFFEVVAVENPSIRVTNVHPGVIETLIGRKSLDAGAPFPIDEGEAHPLTAPSYVAGIEHLYCSSYHADAYFLLVSLPADFLVWAASPEAAFLRGKFVWCNWDVEELMARAKEIEEGNALTLGLNGWPHLDYTSR